MGLQIWIFMTISFVASREKKLEEGGKYLSSIIFITDMHGNMLTDFITYDSYNKYEGITVKNDTNDKDK